MNEPEPTLPEEPFDVESTKLAINNLIWVHAPACTTLREAERKALEILGIIARES